MLFSMKQNVWFETLRKFFPSIGLIMCDITSRQVALRAVSWAASYPYTRFYGQKPSWMLLVFHFEIAGLIKRGGFVPTGRRSKHFLNPALRHVSMRLLQTFCYFCVSRNSEEPATWRIVQLCRWNSALLESNVFL